MVWGCLVGVRGWVGGWVSECVGGGVGGWVEEAFKPYLYQSVDAFVSGC